MDFSPSAYQLAILEKQRKGHSDIVVSAFAGSGKTSLLQYLSENIAAEYQNDAVFLAFNRSIANELERRLPEHVTCKTVHSVGMGALIKHFSPDNVDEWLDKSGKKYLNIVNKVLDKYYDREINAPYYDAVYDAVMLCQLTLTDPAKEISFRKLLDRYDIQYFDGIETLVYRVLQRGVAKADRMISFTDMIWLPNRLELPLPTYGMIYVDEAQDLSRSLRQMIYGMVRDDSTVVAVADRNQAIYSWAGADANSFDILKKQLNAVEMPLSICYRCPKSHLELAQKLVPEIEPAPWAEDGLVRRLGYDGLFDYVKPGDMVICRLVAPLVELCFDLLRVGMPAKIRGVDLTSQLLKFARLVHRSDPGTFWVDPEPVICNYVQGAIQGLMFNPSKEVEMHIANLQDKSRALIAIMEHAKTQFITSISALKDYIDQMFSDNIRGAVCLSTIHKAKGLEADNVFFLGYNRMPHPSAKQPWQIQQEKNLEYVGLTRAKKELSLVTGKPRKKE